MRVGDPNIRPMVSPTNFRSFRFYFVSCRYSTARKLSRPCLWREVLFQNFFSRKKEGREKEKNLSPGKWKVLFTLDTVLVFLLRSSSCFQPPSRGVKKLRNSNIRQTFQATRKHFRYEQRWILRARKRVENLFQPTLWNTGRASSSASVKHARRRVKSRTLEGE